MIKKLILIAALALTAPHAYAKDNALCMNSQQGGKITLTPAKLEDKRMVAVATDGKGGVLYGAWLMIGKQTLMIEWEGGSQSVFDMLQFRPCKF